VDYQEKSILSSNAQRADEVEYGLFKNTQKQLITSRFVLAAALKKPEDSPIFHLAILKKQADPVAWIMRHLSVSFPGNAEIMEVSISAYDPKDAADIVTAAVDAYMSEIVDFEKDRRRQRLSELDRLMADKEQDVRDKRGELKQLADQLGTAERATLNLKQKLTMEELLAWRQELIHSQSELERLRGELASRQAELDAVKNTEISDMECEMFAQSDPLLKKLSQEITYWKMDTEYATGAQTPEDKSAQDTEKRQAVLERMEKDYARRIAQIREEISRKRQADVEKDVKRLEASIDIANTQQQATEKDVDRLRKQSEQYGHSSVDVEMLRADIENREKTLNSIASEREKLKVELRAPSRVTQLQKRAEVPTAKTPLFCIF
jgi:chromosome segregation ATPase